MESHARQSNVALCRFEDVQDMGWYSNRVSRLARAWVSEMVRWKRKMWKCKAAAKSTAARSVNASGYSHSHRLSTSFARRKILCRSSYRLCQDAFTSSDVKKVTSNTSSAVQGPHSSTARIRPPDSSRPLQFGVLQYRVASDPF